MTITLYKTKSANEKLDKSLTSALSFNGTLRDETNVETPVITLECGNISDYNYMKIDAFHRYYFIHPENVRNNLWRISGKSDPLMSFASEIRQLNAIIDKQENETTVVNKMYNDGTYKSTPEVTSEIINFPETLSTGIPVYFLTCI